MGLAMAAGAATMATGLATIVGLASPFAGATATGFTMTATGLTATGLAASGAGA